MGSPPTAAGGVAGGAHCSSSCTCIASRSCSTHRSYGRSSTTSGRRSRTARRALLGPGSTAATIQIRIQTYRCTPHRTAGVWMWFVFLNLMNITTATLSMCAKRGWTDPSVQCRGVVLIPLPIQYIPIPLIPWTIDMPAMVGELAFYVTLSVCAFLLLREIITMRRLKMPLHRHSADLASCTLPFAALPFRILGNIAETDAAGEPLLVVHKLLIGVTCWLAWLRFMQTALKKSETLGPMVLMVQSMLTGDVFEFLIVFTFFLLAFAEVIFSITSSFDGAPFMMELVLLLFRMTLNPDSGFIASKAEDVDVNPDFAFALPNGPFGAWKMTRIPELYGWLSNGTALYDETHGHTASTLEVGDPPWRKPHAPVSSCLHDLTPRVPVAAPRDHYIPFVARALRRAADESVDRDDEQHIQHCACRGRAEVAAPIPRSRPLPGGHTVDLLALSLLLAR